MKKKILGNTDIRVSVAGFGVLPMGPSQLALPVEQGAGVIRYALEHGIQFSGYGAVLPNLSVYQKGAGTWGL